MVLGKHHNCDKVWLTGADVPGDGGAFRNTVSADQLMAEVQGQPRALPRSKWPSKGTRWPGRATAFRFPPSAIRATIFNMLFGVEKDSKETIRRRLTRRGSILDVGRRRRQARQPASSAAKTAPSSTNISPPSARWKFARSGPNRG